MVGMGNRRVLPLCVAEAAAVVGGVCTKLVGCHVDPLIVFPGNENLVVLVEHVGVAPGHCLLLQILLADDGHLVQPQKKLKCKSREDLCFFQISKTFLSKLRSVKKISKKFEFSKSIKDLCFFLNFKNIFLNIFFTCSA
jgi:hypothetical protein